jgi:hypothetical protein
MERYKEQSNCGIQGYHSFLGGRRVRRLFLFINYSKAQPIDLLSSKTLTQKKEGF